MNKKELQAKIETLKQEIAELEKITQIGNTEGFELFIEKVKKDMIENVKEENWSALKQNKAEIEKMRSFTSYIEKQTTLIEEKESELEDLQYKLSHYQQSLFEKTEQENPEYTGIIINGNELQVGDVFCQSDKNYLIVKKSEEINGKYAILSNFFEDEKMLQYPTNQGFVEDTDYVGNIFAETDNDIALEALSIISDYHAALNSKNSKSEQHNDN